MINKKLIKIFVVPLLLLYCINLSACSSGQANNKKAVAADKKTDTLQKVSHSKQADIIKESTDENNKDSKKSTDTHETVIVIDPGHGNKANSDKEPIAPGSSEMKIKDGGGATGVLTKTPEYVINRKVALKLEKLLEEKGFKVVMTKTMDSEDPGNVDRAETGNKNNAALVIRIHADSCDNESASGASMLVPAAINSNTKSIYSESKRCGQIILNTVTKEVGMNNRGISERSDMTGFNWSTVPVILIEMGFLSNPTEDKLLSDDTYESKIAAALSDGIAEAENTQRQGIK